MGEYLVDDHGIFDTGDDSDCTTTLGAGFYVDIEHPLAYNMSALCCRKLKFITNPIKVCLVSKAEISA